MTLEKFLQLYYKYQPWFGRPIEIATASSAFGERNYKKFLLIDIKGLITKEEGKEELVSEASVEIKDLVNFQVHAIPLVTFDQAVRLINLSSAKTINLSNKNKTGHLTVDNSLGYVEFFIIQINSHFGKTPSEWTKVAGNIAVNFNSKRTNHNPISIPDKLFLSSLITNQIQPIFNLSRIYPIGQPNYNSQNDFFDTIEIVLEEISPINEDYEVNFVFEKRNLLSSLIKVD